jgi:hypothetical protein
MEEHLCNSIYFQDLYYRNGRVLDKENGKTLIDDVKWVAKTTDTLAVFAVDDKRGFLNRFTGEVVVPCIYDRAWVFAEGMAAVEKNGKLLFIDQSGNVVIDKGHIAPFETNGFFFRSGYCVVNNAMYKEVMDVIENHIVDTDKMVEPTIKNDLAVDAISRADVLNHLANIAKVKAKSDAQKSLMGRCMFMVENMPSITPQEPKTGHWKYFQNEKGDWMNVCSNCSSDCGVGYPYNYCPNCGADMRGVEE